MVHRRFATLEKQRKTVIDLSQNKMHKTRELKDTPLVCNMVSQITHLFNIIEERGFASNNFFQSIQRSRRAFFA